MSDYFFQMGLSNACFSLALALVAMVVGALTRRPHIAHLLWLLVFVKLVTPPIVAIPVVPFPAPSETAPAVQRHAAPGLPAGGDHAPGVSRTGLSSAGPDTLNAGNKAGLFPLEHTGIRRDKISERGRKLTVPKM